MTNSTESADVFRALATKPMGRFQIGTVVTCLVINLLDGFDVLAISFAAPQVAVLWNIPPDQLGILFSSGLAGMVLASIFISGVADYIGRRRTILICLGVIAAGMFASGMAQDVWTLCAFRFVVGLGVGTILPALNTLVAEFSSDRRREFAVACMQAGYPGGAVLGGIVAVALLASFGWRGIFFAGGLASLIVFVVALRYLPESLDYLLLRRPPGVLDRINSLLSKLDQPLLEQLPAVTSSTNEVTGYRALLVNPTLASVVILSATFFFVMACFYFVASWTPKLLVDAGLSLSEGISGGIFLSLGGIIGGLCLGWMARHYRVTTITAIYLLLAPATMWLFSLMTSLSAMLTASFVMGFFTVGAMVGIYATAPSVFATSTRATGTGFAVGIGRFGAILGPLVVGYLIASGWTTEDLYRWFGMPTILSAMLLLWLGRRLGVGSKV